MQVLQWWLRKKADRTKKREEREREQAWKNLEKFSSEIDKKIRQAENINRNGRK
jgi:hypothetical protein